LADSLHLDAAMVERYWREAAATDKDTDDDDED
jgi:hypothetical protein